MEVDHVTYIFGSFTRRKSEENKRRSFQPSALSAGNSPLRAPAPASASASARSSAYGSPAPPPGTPRTGSAGSEQARDLFACRLCKKRYVEPRVLACLHTFCTRCLQSLPQEGSELVLWNENERGYEAAAMRPQREQSGSDSGGSGTGSAGSGYESDPRRRSGSDASWHSDPPDLAPPPKKYGILTRKVSGKSMQFLVCPRCEFETTLPLGGISALPLDYVLQHRMLVASLNRDKSRILCDLCTTDVQAESRCTECLLSVCAFCREAHSRQRATSRHRLAPLAAGDVDRLRRHRVCSTHPDAELNIYCATCAQVICRDCCVLSHAGHALAGAARAAEERARLLRDAVERARAVPAHAARAAQRLHAVAHKIDGRAAAVEQEIAEFSREYALAVEAHGRALAVAAGRARARARSAVAVRTGQLDARAEDAKHAVQFAEEALSEARHDELLALSGPVLRRLEHCADLAPLLGELPAHRLTFVRDASPARDRDFPLVGRVVTQAVAPHHCRLRLEGLQELRAHRKANVTLQLRDVSDEPLSYGGESVAGYYRLRDANTRPSPLEVADNKDGTYTLSFTPEAAGALQIAVLVNNKPIKDSPFACSARVARPHAGKFHCCSFCSSGGSKGAACGCGASMGGGYKGCGHGHAGHPGCRHWSCCGSTKQHSECTRTNSAIYQFSL